MVWGKGSISSQLHVALCSFVVYVLVGDFKLPPLLSS